MCFGIRISSPFDLNTLNIPIQNIKCPKNTKNHFLPSHYLWSLNCVVFAQACQTQSVWPAMLSMNHIVRCNILSSWNLKYSQFLSIRDSLKEKPSVGYSHKPRKIYNWSNWLITSVFGFLIGTPYFGHSGSLLAHSVGVFRALNILNIGMFKGFRSNGLEILILKHTWKSIIGPLEQI